MIDLSYLGTLGSFCISVALMLSLGLAPSAVALQKDSKELKQRFQADAPSQWREYRDWAAGLHGSITNSINREDKSKKIASSVRIEVKQAKDSKLLIYQQLLETGEAKPGALAQVQCYNPEYSFLLEGSAKGGHWAIKKLQKQIPEKINPITSELKRSFSSVLESLVNCFGEKLEDLVARDTFVLKDIKWVRKFDQELVEIDFSNDHPIVEKGKPFSPIQAGIIWLDPEKHWCMLGADLDIKFEDGASKVSIVAEITKGSDGYAIPKRVVKTELSENYRDNRTSIAKRTTISDFSLVKPAIASVRRTFTLSDFGLPEPLSAGPSTSESGSNWQWWLILAGVGVVSFGIWYRYGRRAKPTPA